MVTALLKFILTAILVYGLAKLLPGIHLDGVGSAIILMLVLAVLNAIVRPVLSLLGLPITVLTLGLFALVINVIIIQLADWLMSSFDAEGFFWPLIFSFGITLANSLVDGLVGDKKN